MQIDSKELEFIQERRNKTFNQMKENSILMISPNPSSKRSNDTDNKYKPNSDLVYLSGYSEEDTVLLLSKNDVNKCYLSVLPKDQDKETWTGRRYGPEGAKNNFKVDEAFSNEEFDKKIEELFKNCFTIYYSFGINENYDNRFLEAYKSASRNIPRNYIGPREIINSNQIVHELRLVKDKLELNNLKKSCKIAAQGHIEGMKYIKPDLFEYQIQSKVEQKFLSKGGLHPSYPSICATGENATILHYTRNTDLLKDGDLFLIDAGTEYNHYCSDITRTYPVNGKFSDIQIEVYNIVLESQLKAIQRCKPGNSFLSVHEEALKTITKGLVQLGILKDEMDKLIREEQFKPYYMHRTSHWLGLETHDSGNYCYLKNKKDLSNINSRILEPGMILTVEPGLYFQPHIKDIPKKLKGIGVRIEDDILITEEGYEDLTSEVPKTIKDIETLMNDV
ncbi:MAG: Xaa-Pro aminopeptidase [Candidatus Heimdallarchaeota archaeon LC_3]|nr:MAG: Xaa-Pro aminopeptidase [Candidatus Heimdallarchaeota archaeon LC_3]